MFRAGNQNAEQYPDIDLLLHTEEIEKLKQTVDEVFLDRLDLTWMKSETPPNNDYSRVLTKLPVEPADDDGQVEYRYSRQGFRSEEFLTDHDGKNHVLFMGCSETEGYGANIGEFWSSILYNEISVNNDISGFMNLARGGWGWEKIIANSIIYFEKYGRPDYAFILLPNISRFWQYFLEDNQWYYVQRYINDHISIKSARSEGVLDYKKQNKFDRALYFTEFIRFVSGWKLYLKYCESIGVRVIWSTWLANDSDNIKNIGIFDNFVYFGSDDEIRELVASIAVKKKQSDGLKSNDLKRRDGHHGTITHQIWANSFLQKAKELGWEIAKKDLY